MGRSKLEKAKGRKERGSFLALPHNLIGGEEWAGLSALAVKLLIDLSRQYNGKNNGDLTIAWSVMERRGWVSKQSLYRARDELLEKGFIILTRRGGRNSPNLYAITWQPIDECGGKLDISPTVTAPATWKKSCPDSRTLLAR